MNRRGSQLVSQSVTQRDTHADGYIYGLSVEYIRVCCVSAPTSSIIAQAARARSLLNIKACSFCLHAPSFSIFIFWLRGEKWWIQSDTSLSRIHSDALIDLSVFQCQSSLCGADKVDMRVVPMFSLISARVCVYRRRLMCFGFISNLKSLGAALEMMQKSDSA